MLIPTGAAAISKREVPVKVMAAVTGTADSIAEGGQ